MPGGYKDVHQLETVSIVRPGFDVGHELPIVDIVTVVYRHLVLRIE